jgi:predicted DNA-binding transcriptional regulator YafY
MDAILVLVLETSARLLRLLSLLQTPREWTGSTLAGRLGVSPRTVRKDIDRLRALGYPVRATRGATGGYRLEAGAAMPPLLLDDDEAVAVALGLRTAAGGTVAGIEEASLRALAKLEQVLPARLRRRVQALQTYTVAVGTADRGRDGRGGPLADPDVLATLAGACRDHERLRFDYHSHDGTGSLRVVEPYRLVTWGRRWYLLAWDVDRSAWRTFRVDRIAPRTPPTGAHFTPREPPEDAADHIMRGVSTAGWRYRARLVVHAPAERVGDRINAAVGTVEPIDERTCLLHTGADTLETLAVYAGLLGVDFTVADPPELRAVVDELAERYRRAVR